MSVDTGRILVAGVGNVFLGDDGFGPEVVRELMRRPLPDRVQVHDIGIRGVHLAYELLDGCDLLLLIDSADTGAAPGTVSLVEPIFEPWVDPSDDAATSEASIVDAHGLTPDEVFALVRRLGGEVCRTLVVACQPADLDPGMGLSEPVRSAIPGAVRLVEEVLEKEVLTS